MSGQGAVFGIFVFGSVMAAYSWYNNKSTRRIGRLLDNLRSGQSQINCVLGANPLVISEHEKVVAVLPQTELLEPKSVRVRQGTRNSSSVRWVRGYSSGSGSYTSTIESHDQLKTVDEGTLVLTDQRIAFLGTLKTITVDVKKISGVDEHRDGIALHCEGKEKVESFKISKKLRLTYEEDQDVVSVPFVGQILGCLISLSLGGSGRSRAAAPSQLALNTEPRLIDILKKINGLA
jgi:hypothetical protein